MTNATINHLFIIDTTARTSEERSRLMSRVNDSLNAIKQSASKFRAPEHRITFMTFHGQRIKCLYHDIDVREVPEFYLTQKAKTNFTQLFDAIGAALATWRALGHRRIDQGKHFVSIFTQGIDSGSKKYARCTLRAIINSLTIQGWQFTLIGSNSLIPFIAEKLGITNYYNQGAAISTRERNFLMTRLRRQWQQQQILSQSSVTSPKAA